MTENCFFLDYIYIYKALKAVIVFHSRLYNVIFICRPYSSIILCFCSMPYTSIYLLFSPHFSSSSSRLVTPVTHSCCDLCTDSLRNVNTITTFCACFTFLFLDDFSHCLLGLGLNGVSVSLWESVQSLVLSVSS